MGEVSSDGGARTRKTLGRGPTAFIALYSAVRVCKSSRRVPTPRGKGHQTQTAAQHGSGSGKCICNSPMSHLVFFGIEQMPERPSVPPLGWRVKQASIDRQDLCSPTSYPASPPNHIPAQILAPASHPPTQQARSLPRHSCQAANLNPRLVWISTPYFAHCSPTALVDAGSPISVDRLLRPNFGCAEVIDVRPGATARQPASNVLLLLSTSSTISSSFILSRSATRPLDSTKQTRSETHPQSITHYEDAQLELLNCSAINSPSNHTSR